MTPMIDLTHTITNLMPVFPGDPSPKLQQSHCIAQDHYTDFELHISMHCGTHLDGPLHFINNSPFLSNIDITQLIGDGMVIDVRNQECIEWKDGYEELIPCNSIVLFCTGWSRFFGTSTYFDSYPTITSTLVDHLIRKCVKMVGFDTPSPDSAPHSEHSSFLSNHVLILENLCNLEKLIGINNLEIIALPLKIQSDSAPTRVIARF